MIEKRSFMEWISGIPCSGHNQGLYVPAKYSNMLEEDERSVGEEILSALYP